jgi:hypothetical protein
MIQRVCPCFPHLVTLISMLTTYTADTLILFGHNGGGGVTYGSVTQHDADCARYDASDDAIDVVMGK